MPSNPHGTLDPDVILPLYEARLVSMANSLNPLMGDELTQVGRIAMWEALTRYVPESGSLPSFLVMKARYAMLSALRRKSKEIPMDFDGGDDFDFYADVETEAIRKADAFSVRDRVFKAVCALPAGQRKYVLLRFYEQADVKLLTHVFGYNPTGMWNNKQSGAKVKLQRELADLND